jgi:hypothetical protein
MAGYQSSDEPGPKRIHFGEVGITEIEPELGLPNLPARANNPLESSVQEQPPQQAVPLLRCPHKLEGNDELPNEGVIGTDLFHRPSDYSSGDGPIVCAPKRAKQGHRRSQPTACSE